MKKAMKLVSISLRESSFLDFESTAILQIIDRACKCKQLF